MFVTFSNGIDRSRAVWLILCHLDQYIIYLDHCKMANKDIPCMEVPPLTVNVLMGLSVSNNNDVITPSYTAGQAYSMLLLFQAASLLATIKRGNSSKLNLPVNNSPVNINVKVFNTLKVKECPVYVLRRLTEQSVTTPKKFVKKFRNNFFSSGGT